MGPCRRYKARQSVGWVAPLCETHHLNRVAMGYAVRSDKCPICLLNPSYAFGNNPSRLAMIRSSVRFGRIRVISAWNGSGEIS
jgi:hypothetical protein